MRKGLLALVLALAALVSPIATPADASTRVVAQVNGVWASRVYDVVDYPECNASGAVKTVTGRLTGDYGYFCGSWTYKGTALFPGNTLGSFNVSQYCFDYYGKKCDVYWELTDPDGDTLTGFGSNPTSNVPSGPYRFTSTIYDGTGKFAGATGTANVDAKGAGPLKMEPNVFAGQFVATLD